MEQVVSVRHGGDPNPLDSEGLCLLSLDGGGVRGLSTLYILKSIMDHLNEERKAKKLDLVKPCDVFDLIGGTSTGGLIAIMLGRLEMDVDECISAYNVLAQKVFGEKPKLIPINAKGEIRPRFRSSKLGDAVEEVLFTSGAPVMSLLNDGVERGCKTFVCTVDRYTKDIVHLRSYTLPGQPTIDATIIEAALATSAATTYFDPVSIGDRTFADGGLGANNPVDEVEEEASRIWCPYTGELKPLVKCFISIGTGNPGVKPFQDKLLNFLRQTLVDISTETEHTGKKFMDRWAKQYDEKRYFRFNVEHGLQDIALDEYQRKGDMEAATEMYLEHAERRLRVRDCVQNLRQKQTRSPDSLSTVIEEWTISLILLRYGYTSKFRRCYTGIPQSPTFSDYVTLYDARGGITRFFLEHIDSWQHFIDGVLKFKFETFGTRKIERGDWFLENRVTGRRLDPMRDWKAVVLPGQKLDMTMVFRRRPESVTACPSCHALNEGSSSMAVQCSKCGLSYQRIQEELDIGLRHPNAGIDVLGPQFPTIARPQQFLPPPGPDTAIEDPEEDIRCYTRVQIVDTNVKVHEISSKGRTDTVSSKEMEDMKALAEHLLVSFGFPAADYWAILENCLAQISALHESAMANVRTHTDTESKPPSEPSSMSKTNLVNIMSRKTGLTRRDAEAALNAFTAAVSASMKKKDRVILVGFGTWEVRQRAARKGINPRTKEEIRIPAAHVPVFKAGKSLKSAIS